jgi:hypothetical protein
MLEKRNNRLKIISKISFEARSEDRIRNSLALSPFTELPNKMSGRNPPGARRMTQRPPDVTYGGKPVPEEGWYPDGQKVYRGHQDWLKDKEMKKVRLQIAA